jgi:hypothetical protein
MEDPLVVALLATLYVAPGLGALALMALIADVIEWWLR